MLPPLGNSTIFCSRSSDPDEDGLLPHELIAHGTYCLRETVRQRHEWLSTLRRLSSVKRLRCCGLHVDTERATHAEVRINGHGRCRWANIMRCGLRWPCPVCAPWAAAKERRRIKVALAQAMRAEVYDDDALDFEPDKIEAGDLPADARRRYGVIFLTPTLPHEWGEDLKATADTVIKAWNYATGSGRRRGFGGARETWIEAFGVEGFVRCFDLTIGANGWHPHVHAAIIVDADKVREVGAGVFLAWFRAWFFRRWDWAVRKRLGIPDCRCLSCGWEGEAGPYVPTSRQRQSTSRPYDPRDYGPGCPKCGGETERPPCVHQDYGVDAEWVDSIDHLSDYIANKILGPALELTEGHRKRGRGDLVGTIRVPAVDEETAGEVLAELGHRTPLELLEDLCTRYAEFKDGVSRDSVEDRALFELDLRLWHEYERAMKGRSAVRTSKGFWSHPIFGVEGMDDDEQIDYLASCVHPDERLDADAPEPLLAVFPWLYTQLVRHQLDGWALRVCEDVAKGYLGGHRVLQTFAQAREAAGADCRWTHDDWWWDTRPELKRDRGGKDPPCCVALSWLVSAVEAERERDRLAAEQEEPDR